MHVNLYQQELSQRATHSYLASQFSKFKRFSANINKGVDVFERKGYELISEIYKGNEKNALWRYMEESQASRCEIQFIHTYTPLHGKHLANIAHFLV